MISNSMVQNGDRNTMIGTLNGHLTINNQCVGFSGGIPNIVDRSFYNLFVIDSATAPTFTLPKHVCLSQSISLEVRERFKWLNEKDSNDIKTFPTLLMSLNEGYASAGEYQVAHLGFVQHLSLGKKHLTVQFTKLTDIPQAVLNDMLQELKMEGAESLNELNRVHWTIKKADLIGVLVTAGLINQFFNALGKGAI